MSRKTIAMLISASLSIALMFAWAGLMPENPRPILQSKERPDWVPETAVYRNVTQTWIDVAAADDGDPTHFICTFYDNYTSMGVEKATYELEGAITKVEDVRDLVKFYDGYEIYMKDDRVMFMCFN